MLVSSSHFPGLLKQRVSKGGMHLEWTYYLIVVPLFFCEANI